MNARPRALGETARICILNRLLNVCNLEDVELKTSCIRQLWTFKTHALQSLVEYSTLVRFGFHCADPSMCISNLQLLLSGKKINSRTRKVDKSSAVIQLQPNLEYVFANPKHQQTDCARGMAATVPLPDAALTVLEKRLRRRRIAKSMRHSLWYCEACGLECNSQQQWDTHVSSRQHQFRQHQITNRRS